MQGTRVGTPLYLSPELIKQQPYDFKVDIWAMGCVLYHVACLQPPFKGENLIALGNSIVYQEPKPLPSIYSTKLQSFIFKLIAKKPYERPNVSDILRQLNDLLKKDSGVTLTGTEEEATSATNEGIATKQIKEQRQVKADVPSSQLYHKKPLEQDLVSGKSNTIKVIDQEVFQDQIKPNRNAYVQKQNFIKKHEPTNSEIYKLHNQNLSPRITIRKLAKSPIREITSAPKSSVIMNKQEVNKPAEVHKNEEVAESKEVIKKEEANKVTKEADNVDKELKVPKEHNKETSEGRRNSSLQETAQKSLSVSKSKFTDSKGIQLHNNPAKVQVFPNRISSVNRPLIFTYRGPEEMIQKNRLTLSIFRNMACGSDNVVQDKPTSLSNRPTSAAIGNFQGLNRENTDNRDSVVEKQDRKSVV